MFDTLSRYTGSDITLAVDTNMQALDRGMGVATLSLLVKDELRPTHLPKMGAGCRTQSSAWTSHGMQAIFYAETKANYVNLFDACYDLWTARHPNKKPLQQQMSLQLHKDFHPSIEEARRHVWPLSRPCDDFFHFKEKSHTTMQAKCQQLVSRKGKFVKKYVHFALEVINILRFVPTLPLFSWLWKAFLATLRRLGEPTLADWLQTYERPMPAIFQGHHSPNIIFVSFWVGFDGILPGSGSGSEPAEAIHSSWQRELNQLGGRGNIGHALHVLQKLYTDHWQHWYSWTASTPLAFVPPTQDPQLVNGTALTRAGRTCAANFAKLAPTDLYVLQQCNDCSWVAFASAAAVSPLNRALTLKVLQVLIHPATLSARSLPDLFTPDGNLCLQSFKFHFEHVVYLKVRPTSILCSCPAAAMHAQCEPSTFLRSLGLPNFPQPPVILTALPSSRKRTGRPTKSDAPPRKRRCGV